MCGVCHVLEVESLCCQARYHWCYDDPFVGQGVMVTPL